MAFTYYSLLTVTLFVPCHAQSDSIFQTKSKYKVAQINCHFKKSHISHKWDNKNTYQSLYLGTWGDPIKADMYTVISS